MKAKPHMLLSLFAVPMLCIALHASATPMTPITNIVHNGGFEAGSFGSTASWTQGGNTSNTGVDMDSAHSGSFGAFLGPSESPGSLSQNLSTTAGSIYELSFFMNSGGGDSESVNGGFGTVFFQVFWGGVMIFDTSAPPSSYQQFQFFNLTASGPTTELKFVFQNDPSFFHLDDVVAGVSAVPEALSTLWLALPAFGMIGFVQLRRNVA
jgi:hypothetical protein